MKIIGRLMIIYTVLSVSILVFSSSGATIPIVAGNTWTYQHQYSNDNFFNQRSKDGLFFLTISSVSVHGDSLFFRVTSVDSGMLYTIGINWRHVDVTYDTNDYLLTNNTLFAKDTAGGLWTAYGGSVLSYRIRPDSGYHFMATTPGFDSVDYQRNTDSADVIINGRDTGRLYTTGSHYAHCTRNDTGPRIGTGDSDNTSDTTQWLENIGLFRYVHSDYHNVLGVYDMSSYTGEYYSLVSFNGTTVSIAPKSSSARSRAIAARQNPAPRYRKIVLFAGQPLGNAGAIRCTNLLGKNIDRLRPSQVLIYKK